MSKPLVIVSCPADTFSGYGARSRDILKSLFRLKKYEVKIIPQRWGSTPFGALDANNPDDKEILDNIYPYPQIQTQPDVWIQITVPNEFQPIGKFNIGITAGIESTIFPAPWIDGCNRMNLILTSSEFSKNILLSTTFEEKNNQTGQVTRQVKAEVPVEVLFEGADLNKYFPIEDSDLPDTEIVNTLDEVEEDFCFLFVGHWLSGNIGEDRKNVGLMIKLFLETFKGKGVKPALILKTSHGPASIMDRDEILKKIDAIRQTVAGQNLPNIYLLHGELQDEDMNYLYNHPKVKTMISFTKGEGFGRPLLEFSLIKKPIIVSGWSGHMDFLSPDFTTFIFGELRNIHESAANDMLLKESQWFNVVESSAVDAMKDIYKNYDKQIPKAKQQAHKNKQSFSIDKMQERLDEVFEKYIPKKVELKLPKFDKIELPK